MGIRTRRQVMERDRKKDLIMKFLGHMENTLHLIDTKLK
jgi:hypothetical protein